jgi:hypothetical protein
MGNLNSMRKLDGYSQKVLSKLTKDGKSTRTLLSVRSAPKKFKLDRTKESKIDRKSILEQIAKQEELDVIDL